MRDLPLSLPSQTSELLIALQFGDSFFPSGASSFSWGLEMLHADRVVTCAEELDQFIAAQIEWRWATCDRPALSHAFRHAEQMDAVREADWELDSLCVGREAREGGRRLGATLLQIHTVLGTPSARAYSECIGEGGAPGQLAVVQGYLGRSAGLAEDTTTLLSAYGLCSGLVAAAIRLGIVGHRDAQRILFRRRPTISRLMLAPIGERGCWHSSSLAGEIAMMRHEASDARMFAN